MSSPAYIQNSTSLEVIIFLNCSNKSPIHNEWPSTKFYPPHPQPKKFSDIPLASVNRIFNQLKALLILIHPVASHLIKLMFFLSINFIIPLYLWVIVPFLIHYRWTCIHFSYPSLEVLLFFYLFSFSHCLVFYSLCCIISPITVSFHHNNFLQSINVWVNYELFLVKYYLASNWKWLHHIATKNFSQVSQLCHPLFHPNLVPLNSPIHLIRLIVKSFLLLNPLHLIFNLSLQRINPLYILDLSLLLSKHATRILLHLLIFKPLLIKSPK